MSALPAPRAAILGLGSYAPSGILTNADLERMVDTSDAWIVERSGIRERRRASPEEATSDLALPAVRAALADAGCPPEAVEAIYVGTATPDTPFPSTACVLQAALGTIGGAALDLTAACSGFLYALAMGHDSVASGRYRRVLCVGAETLSRITDYTERSTCVLFGDGAGAVLVGPADTPGGHRILDTRLHADGRQTGLLNMPGGGSRMPASVESVTERKHCITMDGREVFKFAVRAIPDAVDEVLQGAGLKGSDIRWFVPHQMNTRIMRAAGERSGIPPERIMSNIERYGNTSSASIPMVLDEYRNAGKVKKGDLLLMVALGGGFTWATALVEW